MQKRTPFFILCAPFPYLPLRISHLEKSLLSLQLGSEPCLRKALRILVSFLQELWVKVRKMLSSVISIKLKVITPLLWEFLREVLDFGDFVEFFSWNLRLLKIISRCLPCLVLSSPRFHFKNFIKSHGLKSPLMCKKMALTWWWFSACTFMHFS